MADIGTDHNVNDWRAAGGNIQSLTFYRCAIDRLKKFDRIAEMMSFEFDEDTSSVGFPVISVHDYGCGQGDGTALLQSAFPMADVLGIDTSRAALTEARYRWPTLNFAYGDIRKPNNCANIIYTSHTIEHLSDPINVVLNLLDYCELLICIVPTIDEGHDGGHKGAIQTIDLYTGIISSIRKIFDIEGWSTLRKGGNGEAVVEGNNLFILRGTWRPKE